MHDPDPAHRSSFRARNSSTSNKQTNHPEGLDKCEETWNSWSSSKMNPRLVPSNVTGRRVVRCVLFVCGAVRSAAQCASTIWDGMSPHPSCLCRRCGHRSEVQTRRCLCTDHGYSSFRASIASQISKGTTGYIPMKGLTLATRLDVERASFRGAH